MFLLDFFLAVLLLGMPVSVLSWFVFSWLYLRGHIDRNADRKAFAKSLKSIEKKAREDEDRYGAGFLIEQMGWFGGGFYGLAALWTFIAAEIMDVVNFIRGFDLAELIDEGPVGLFIDFLINQFTNAVTALFWFTYWPADSILVWILVAYMSYWAGIEIARRQIGPELETLREHGLGIWAYVVHRLKVLWHKLSGEHKGDV